MAFDTVIEPIARPGALRRVAATAGALGLAALLGVLFAFQWVEGERERELRSWQVRLGIVADSRAAALAEWLESQYAALRELSENASLQLYLTDLALAGAARDADPPEAQYLRNLLTATAARAGFEARRGPETPANVERTGLAGLALADSAGRPLVATPGMPPLAGRLKRLIDDAPKGERGLLDIHLGPDDQPAIGFLAPVFAVQGDDLVGYVIGLRQLGPDFYGRLDQPGETARTAETVLVRGAGAAIEYLSPLSDAPPLKRQLARTTARLDAAELLDRPGGFGQFVDYAGREVLATSRAVAGTPWTLIRKVGRDEALGETDRRLRATVAVLLLAILGAGVAIVAFWRHGASVRASEMAERFRLAKERNETLAEFLQVVTDGQPTAIVAVDDEGTITFANRRAAALAGATPADAVRKSLSSVLGPARAKPYDEANRRALAEGRHVTETLDGVDESGRRQVLKADHIPLPGDARRRAGALMIVDDVTELTVERERRERILRDLVRTLVAVVDRRDPYSAYHSERVAEVARAVAAEMGLSPLEVETVEIAGAVMNLGKISVPTAVLTKTGPLTDDELKLVRDSVLTSADLVENVAFEGPVAETIRQMQERWDGAGTPRGLSGEAILNTARALAVANAFVGMVSARAWRSGLDFDAAATSLMHQAGQALDRRAVAALINVLDSRGGRERWAHYGAAPAAV